jgi:cytochrome c553
VTPLALPSDPAAIARGGHIARAVGTCVLCHGDDFGGAVYADMGAMGVVAGPNLTRGRGGIGAAFTVTDWVRAIRFGVRRDGTSLIAMPSEVFTNFSDEDLASLVAYLQQVAPVDRDVPRTRFGFLGRALLAVGRLNILVAPKTHHQPRPAAVGREPTPAYGRYLADVSGCHGCHGHRLSGGRVAGPPNLPSASNLTPAGIGGWSETDFVRAMREGRRPDGTALDEFMPWRTYARM